MAISIRIVSFDDWKNYKCEMMEESVKAHSMV